MKQFTYTLSKNEFEEIEGKLHHKILSAVESSTWWDKAEQLKQEGLDDYKIAKELNTLGYRTSQGKRITVDTIRNRRANRTKG